jgi:predicted nuclease of predicted toxin-antitoxin system
MRYTGPRSAMRELRTVRSWTGRLPTVIVVFTHDLDFGALLALTHATGPSVVQVRGQDVLPDAIESIVVDAIRLYEADLAAGALVVIDVGKSRVRVLPI